MFKTILAFLIGGTVFTCLALIGAIVDLYVHGYIKQMQWSWLCIFSHHGLAAAWYYGVWWPFVLVFVTAGSFCAVANEM